ncbi:MAG: hypothetical protein ACREH5_08485, partial [Candidatus Omnitrophota bacterium]
GVELLQRILEEGKPANIYHASDLEALSRPKRMRIQLNKGQLDVYAFTHGDRYIATPFFPAPNSIFVISKSRTVIYYPNALADPKAKEFLEKTPKGSVAKLLTAKIQTQPTPTQVPGNQGARLAKEQGRGKAEFGVSRREVLKELVTGFALCSIPIAMGTYLALRDSEKEPGKKQAVQDRSGPTNQRPFQYSGMLVEVEREGSNISFAAFVDPDTRELVGFGTVQRIKKGDLEKIIVYNPSEGTIETANGKISDPPGTFDTKERAIYRRNASQDKENYALRLKTMREHAETILKHHGSLAPDQKENLEHFIQDALAEEKKVSGARLAEKTSAQEATVAQIHSAIGELKRDQNLSKKQAQKLMSRAEQLRKLMVNHPKKEQFVRRSADFFGSNETAEAFAAKFEFTEKAEPKAVPAPAKNAKKESPSFSRGKELWQSPMVRFLIFGLIFTFAFIPWASQFIEGQFLGIHNAYPPAMSGGDFFIYTRASLAFFDHGVDPYSDAQIYNLFEQGALATGHPNPAYDPFFQNATFGPEVSPWAKGTVGTPFDLLLLYPLAKLVSYVFAYNFWTIAGLIGFIGVITLFFMKLRAPGTRLERTAGVLAALGLFIGLGKPIIFSLFLGQVDALYLVPTGLAIYLWSFRAENHSTRWLVPALLVFAGGVKLFPALLLGYFAWKAFLAWRELPKEKRLHWKSLWQIPEFQVFVFGIGFATALGLVTWAVLGTALLGSWAAKVVTLQGEPIFASIKSNLASYLNFLPIWFNGALEPMTGLLRKIFYPLFTLGTGWLLLRGIRGKSEGLKPLHFALMIAALPTLLPHWWDYYNIVMIIPFLVTFFHGKTIESIRHRVWVAGLLAAAFFLMFLDLPRFFPGLSASFMNLDGAKAAFDQAQAQPGLTDHLNLPESQRPLLLQSLLLGRVLSIANLFFGYPGSLLLFMATWLTLRWKKEKAQERASLETDSLRDSVFPATQNRRRFLITTGSALGLGTLFSFLGANLVVGAGKGKIADQNVIEIPDEHARKEASMELGETLDRLNQRQKKKPKFIKPGGALLDLIPTLHFAEFIAKSDQDLAEALRSGPAVFSNPKREKELQSYYEHYWRTLLSQEDPTPAWRTRGQPGGLLNDVYELCKEKDVPLERVQEPWYVWKSRFESEWLWRQVVQATGRGDFEHLPALSHRYREAFRQFQKLRYPFIMETRTQLKRAPDHLSGFLFIQQPSLAALSSYPAFMDTRRPMTEEVALTYVLEELVRRTRLAKNKNSSEALQFSSEVLKKVSHGGGVAHWFRTLLKRQPPNSVLGAEEILKGLIQDQFIDPQDLGELDSLDWAVDNRSKKWNEGARLAAIDTLEEIVKATSRLFDALDEPLATLAEARKGQAPDENFDYFLRFVTELKSRLRLFLEIRDALRKGEKERIVQNEITEPLITDIEHGYIGEIVYLYLGFNEAKESVFAEFDELIGRIKPSLPDTVQNTLKAIREGYDRMASEVSREEEQTGEPVSGIMTALLNLYERLALTDPLSPEEEELFFAPVWEREPWLDIKPIAEARSFEEAVRLIDSYRQGRFDIVESPSKSDQLTVLLLAIHANWETYRGQDIEGTLDPLIQSMISRLPSPISREALREHWTTLKERLGARLAAEGEPYSVTLKKLDPAGNRWIAESKKGIFHYEVGEVSDKTPAVFIRQAKALLISVLPRELSDRRRFPEFLDKATKELLAGSSDYQVVLLFDAQKQNVAGLYIYNTVLSTLQVMAVRPDYRGTGAADILLEDMTPRVFFGHKHFPFSSRIWRKSARVDKQRIEFKGTIEEFKVAIGMKSRVRVEPDFVGTDPDEPNKKPEGARLAFDRLSHGRRASILLDEAGQALKNGALDDAGGKVERALSILRQPGHEDMRVGVHMRAFSLIDRIAEAREREERRKQMKKEIEEANKHFDAPSSHGVSARRFLQRARLYFNNRELDPAFYLGAARTWAELARETAIEPGHDNTHVRIYLDASGLIRQIEEEEAKAKKAEKAGARLAQTREDQPEPYDEQKAVKAIERLFAGDRKAEKLLVSWGFVIGLDRVKRMIHDLGFDKIQASEYYRLHPELKFIVQTEEDLLDLMLREVTSNTEYVKGGPVGYTLILGRPVTEGGKGGSRAGIEITALDNGRGIKSVRLAVEEKGFTSTGTPGRGKGLKLIRSAAISDDMGYAEFGTSAERYLYRVGGFEGPSQLAPNVSKGTYVKITRFKPPRGARLALEDLSKEEARKIVEENAAGDFEPYGVELTEAAKEAVFLYFLGFNDLRATFEELKTAYPKIGQEGREEALAWILVARKAAAGQGWNDAQRGKLTGFLAGDLSVESQFQAANAILDAADPPLSDENYSEAVPNVLTVLEKAKAELTDFRKPKPSGARLAGNRSMDSVIDLSVLKGYLSALRTFSQSYLVKIEQRIAKGLSAESAFKKIEDLFTDKGDRGKRHETLSYLVYGEVLSEDQLKHKLDQRERTDLYILKNVNRAIKVLYDRARGNKNKFTFQELLKAYQDYFERRDRSVESARPQADITLLNRVLDLAQGDIPSRGARLALADDAAFERILKDLRELKESDKKLFVRIVNALERFAWPPDPKRVMKRTTLDMEVYRKIQGVVGTDVNQALVKKTPEGLELAKRLFEALQPEKIKIGGDLDKENAQKTLDDLFRSYTEDPVIQRLVKKGPRNLTRLELSKTEEKLRKWNTTLERSKALFEGDPYYGALT